jgi:hypothetical protein
MSEVVVVNNMFVSKLNMGEMRQALAGLMIAELGDKPQSALEGILAHNAKLQAEIDGLNKAVAGEKDAIKKMLLEAGAETVIAKKTAEMHKVPSVEAIAEKMLAARIDGIIEAIQLREPEVKRVGGKRATIDGGVINHQGQQIAGLKLSDAKVILFTWALDDTHKDRNYGGALVGKLVAGKFVETFRTNAYTSPSNLMNAAAVGGWGLSNWTGVNHTPFQTGSYQSGTFLTQEQIKAMV